MSRFIEITTTIRVHDPGALIAYAKDRYAACWSDWTWDPEDLAEAALEALLLSNENPSPDLLGFEFVTHTADETPDPHPRKEAN